MNIQDGQVGRESMTSDIYTKYHLSCDCLEWRGSLLGRTFSSHLWNPGPLHYDPTSHLYFNYKAVSFHFTLFSYILSVEKRGYLYDITVLIILGLVSKKRIFCACLRPSPLSTSGAVMCLIVTGLSQYGGSITVPLFSSCLSCLLRVHAAARTGFF